MAASSFAATSVKATVNGMVCAFCEAKDGQTIDAKAITAEIIDARYDVTKLETAAQPDCALPYRPGAAKCMPQTREVSRRVYGFSEVVYLVGGWFAFVQPWLAVLSGA